jgi:hypothetical protein
MKSGACPLKLYHRTTAVNAKNILRDGFLQRRERYTTDFDERGVWFSDQAGLALDLEFDGVVLRIDLDLSDESLAGFEQSEGIEPFREWLIPATVVNDSTKSIRVC